MNELQLSEEALGQGKMLLNRIKRLKANDEKLAQALFGELDADCFGEAYYTVKHFDQNMRSCVYFIKNEYNGLIKIGQTKNLPRRLHQIGSWFYQCGLEPRLKIVMLHLTFPRFLNQLEVYYHRRFSQCRRYGEWFAVDEKELTSIDNFGDGFDFINDTLVCFEEYECLSLKRDSARYDLGLYLDEVIKDVLANRLFKQIGGIREDCWLSGFRSNNTLSLLRDFQKKNVCVRVIGSKNIHTIGRADSTPISFCELKREKFFDDYGYWEQVVNQGEVVVA